MSHDERKAMPQAKKRKAPAPINRGLLLVRMVDMPSTFTWHEITSAIGDLGSESQLRHILLDEWKWVRATNDTLPTRVFRKGKCVGGRPQTVYRKTAAGEARIIPPATVLV